MDDDIFGVIEAARITPDGKACVRKAREIAQLAVGQDGGLNVEVLAEARQWLKLGLEHDKATDTKILREIKERLEARDVRRARLQDARGRRAKPASAEGVDGSA